MCHQLNSDLWRRCQLFYKLTGNYGEDPQNHKIRIQGLKIDVLPHQAFCVFWQMVTERTELRGGFVGDEMGMGKVRKLSSALQVPLLSFHLFPLLSQTASLFLLDF